MMLENGVTNQGAVSRKYDQYGKRMHVATPVRDMSKKDSTKMGKSAVDVPAVDSNTRRVNVGL